MVYFKGTATNKPDDFLEKSSGYLAVRSVHWWPLNYNDATVTASQRSTIADLQSQRSSNAAPRIDFGELHCGPSRAPTQHRHAGEAPLQLRPSSNAALAELQRSSDGSGEAALQPCLSSTAALPAPAKLHCNSSGAPLQPGLVQGSADGSGSTGHMSLAALQLPADSRCSVTGRRRDRGVAALLWLDWPRLEKREEAGGAVMAAGGAYSSRLGWLMQR